jgi:pimeloyl-ACP methyl ester carboxylesterase
MSEATFRKQFERRWVSGRDLSYLVGGAGPPIVLIHGLGGAAENWVDLAPLLSSRFRLLIPDLPWHGASSEGPPKATLRTFSDAVCRCMDAEELSSSVVIGHSFGGQVALQIAIVEPSRVRALVLAPVSGISSSEVKRRYALMTSSWLRPARRTNALRPRILRSRSLRQLAFSSMVSDVDTLSDAGADSFYAGAAAARNTRPALRALLRHDLREELHRVRAPALLIWGARDVALPVSDGVEYSRRLGARLRVLADTGHLPCAERPRLSAALIEEFLDVLPAS